MLPDLSPSITDSKSEDSLQRNSLHVNYPVTLTWQEISAFVKSSMPVPAHDYSHKAYLYSASTVNTPMLSEDFVRNGLSMEEDIVRNRLSMEEDIVRNRLSTEEHIVRNGLNTEDVVRNGLNREDVVRNGPSTEEDIVRNGPSTEEDIVRNGLNREDVVRNGPSTEEDIVRNGLSTEEHIVRNGLNTEDVVRNGLNREDVVRNGPSTEEDIVRNGLRMEDVVINGPSTEEDIVRNGPSTEEDIVRNGPSTEEDIVRNGLSTEEHIVRNGLNTEDVVRNGLNREDVVRNGPSTEEDIVRNGLRMEDVVINGPSTEEDIVRNGPSTEEDIVRNGLRTEDVVRNGLSTKEDIVRNGLSTEDIVIDNEWNNQDCTIQVGPEDEDRTTNWKHTDIHPYIPSTEAVEKCFQDRNMSATNGIDSSVLAERRNHQHNREQTYFDFAAEGNSTKIHIDDFCMPALTMLDKDLQDSDYEFPDKDRNENYPGDAEKTTSEQLPVSSQTTSSQQGHNTPITHTSKQGSKSAQADKNEATTRENEAPLSQKEALAIRNEARNLEPKNPIQDFTGVNEAYSSEQDDITGRHEAVATSKKRFYEPVVYDLSSDTDSAVKGFRDLSTGSEQRDRLGWKGKPKSMTTPWKPILKGLYGIAEPGTLLAVLGASGSGKSTLMNVLAGRKMSDCHVSGSVRVNGVRVKDELHQLCAYVPQHQNFLANLTVKETLAFRATLELRNTSKRERVKMIVDILKILALTEAADTLVGAPGSKRGISGGEMKRLSFACELLYNPPVLLCDEPTSGLDSGMALTTVRVLQSLARLQHTVICIIHQPSSHVFAYFDKVLLLTGGRTAFLGSSTAALDFFCSLGHACPLNFNPADFFVQVLSPPPGHAARRTYCKAEEISKIFLYSHYAREILLDICQLTHDNLSRTKEIRQLLRSSVRRPAAWSLQLRANMWRFWTSLKRSRTELWAKALSCLVQALLVGVLFYRLDVDGGEVGYTQTNVLNVNGALFMITTLTCYTSAQHVIGFFPRWIPIVLRDYHNRLYRLHAFYLAACLVDVPVQLMMPILAICIDYWMVGLVPRLSSFFAAVGIVALSASTSIAFGQALSVVMGDVMVALTVSSTVMVPLLLLSGFVVNVGSIPEWLRWLRFASWFRHTNELLMVNQWKEVEGIVCRSRNKSRGCLFQDGADVLRELNLGEENTVQNYDNLAVLLVLFHALAFLALCLRARWNRC